MGHLQINSYFHQSFKLKLLLINLRLQGGQATTTGISYELEQEYIFVILNRTFTEVI
jgi:hypothetical protein